LEELLDEFFLDLADFGQVIEIFDDFSEGLF
jgi:hypothetical protein